MHHVNLLISGHRRLKALQKLGIDTCEVFIRNYKNKTERIPIERRRSNIDMSIYHEIAVQQKIILV